jgi:ribosomal protein L37AE/L43A
MSLIDFETAKLERAIDTVSATVDTDYCCPECGCQLFALTDDGPECVRCGQIISEVG